MENTKYGRRREGRWTPIRAKAQDTRANPNSWETHLVRKRWDIGLLRAFSPRIMMMMMMMTASVIESRIGTLSGRGNIFLRLHDHVLLKAACTRCQVN